MSLAQKNLERFIQIANSIEIERDLEPLIQYLCSTDYFIAPASMGKNHDCQLGGLFNHCLYMYKALVKINELIDFKYSNQTLFIVAFCHDLCKVNFYKSTQKWKKVGKDWVSYSGYQIVDDLPLGHGEKSLYITSKYLKLTTQEELAIRWHMGAFEVGALICPTVKYSFQRAQVLSPLVRITHSADLLAVSLSQIDGQEN